MEQTPKMNWSKLVMIIILVILVGKISYSLGQGNTDKSKDLFIGNPPTDILLSPSKNITDSATCRFQKSFNTFYTKKITNSELTPPSRIYYNIGDDNEADTVTFVDLDTNFPKVKVNTGESALTIIQNTPENITLGKTDPASGGIVVYNIFKKEGILVYYDSRNFLLIGPTGTLEMGYCN